MHCTVAILLAVICSVSSSNGPTIYPYYTYYKSFPTALYDCAEYYEISNCTVNRYIQESYPNEPEVRRLIRCVLLNLRSWNDTTGVRENVISSFFNPTPGDSCALSRTRDCIQSSEQTCGQNNDARTRAYNAFICYYRQYGNLNNSDQFLPFEELEGEQLTLASLSIANVSPEVLLQFSNGNIVDNPAFVEVLYTIYVQGGFYQMGLFLQNLYIQYGNPEFLSPQLEQCAEAAVNSLPCYVDEKEKLYQIFRNCLVDITESVDLVQRMSRKLLGLGPFCGNNNSSTNAPCQASSTASPASTTPYYNAGPR